MAVATCDVAAAPVVVGVVVVVAATLTTPREESVVWAVEPLAFDSKDPLDDR